MPTDPGTTDSITRDADGRIAEDVLCLTCGYNLRSRTDDDACPECGGAVRATLEELIFGTDSRWLTLVCDSAAIMLAASAILVAEHIWDWPRYFTWWPALDVVGLVRFPIGPVVLIAIEVKLARRRISNRAIRDSVTALIILLHIAVFLGWLRWPFPMWREIVFVVFVIAAWYFTTAYKDMQSMIGTRIVIVLWMACCGIEQVEEYVSFGSRPWMMIVYHSLTVLQAITICLLIRQGAYVLRRLQKDRIASYGRVVMWGYGTVYVVDTWLSAAVLSLVALGVMERPTANSWEWAVVVFCFWALQAFFTICAWLLLLKLTRRIGVITRDHHLAADHSP
jgi:hypothetical protein